MKNNKIELSDFQDWMANEESTYADSSRERKRLTVDLKGIIRVLIAGVRVYEGTDAFEAVSRYNSITDKYVDPYFVKDFKI